MVETMLKDMFKAIFSDGKIKELMEASMAVKLDSILMLEKTFESTNLLNNVVSTAYVILFSVAVTLLTIKFLKKGFEAYILWTDGDPDADVGTSVLLFIKGLVFIIGGAEIYKYGSQVFSEIGSKIVVNTMFQSGSFDAMEGMGLGEILLGLVMILLVLSVQISIYMRGLELLILRMFYPVACTGVLDANNGVLGLYVKKIVQTWFTVLIQFFLMGLGTNLYIHNYSLISLACFILAKKLPSIMSEFLVAPTSTGGGAFVQGAAHATMSAIMGRLRA